jgi:hypothetical protein
MYVILTSVHLEKKFIEFKQRIATIKHHHLSRKHASSRPCGEEILQDAWEVRRHLAQLLQALPYTIDPNTAISIERFLWMALPKKITPATAATYHAHYCALEKKFRALLRTIDRIILDLHMDDADPKPRPRGRSAHIFRRAVSKPQNTHEPCIHR